MKKYDNYKDSGIEWIGEIPEHWEKYRLGIIGKFSSSGIDKKLVDNEPKVKIINYTDIYGNVNSILDSSKDYMIVTTPQSKIDEHSVKKGDLIFTPSSETKEDIGLSALVIEDLENTAFSYHVLRFQFTRIVDLNFKKYICNNYYVLNHFSRNSQGTTRQTLGRNDFKTVEIILPTPEEQTAIANYLDRKTTEIDELIADKKRLLELYEEEKTAIINQAVTKGIMSDVPMKDSGIEWLGEIPEHWESAPLKYLGKFINGYSFKSTEFVSSGIRVLKISNIQNMRIDWSDESFIDEEYYETQSNFRVLKNDLVFALTRPIISTGIKVALMDLDEKTLLNQRNSVYRPTEINVKWIYYLLLSAKFIQEFDSRIDKTGQQPNISSNDIGNITIPVPPSKELSAIIGFVDATTIKIDTEILKVKKLIDLLTEYRTALISEVVTGKIKVI